MLKIDVLKKNSSDITQQDPTSSNNNATIEIKI